MPTKESRIRREMKMSGQHVSDNRDRGVKVSKDAVDCLLRALGYPTTAPLIDTAFVTKLKKEKE